MVKSAKNVAHISAAKAFEATFKGACRHQGMPAAACRPLVEALQRCVAESTPLTAVALSGAAVCGPHAQAVAECLAGYTAVVTLSFLNCSIGDMGVHALAALLRASSCHWWTGSRLQALEVCGDSRQPPGLDLLQAVPTDAAAVWQAAAQPGSRFYAASDARPATAPARMASAGGHRQSPPMGICPPLPADMQPPHDGDSPGDGRRGAPLRRARYCSPKAPRPMTEVRAWALAPTLCCQRGKHGCSASSSPLQDSSSSGGSGTGLPGPTSSAAAADACPAFSCSSLQSLSLVLGVSGLSRLVLDHTLLGDQGISILAEGLGRSRLTALSLQHCNIRPEGVQRLATVLAGVPGDANRRGNSSSTSSNAVGAAGTAAAQPSGQEACQQQQSAISSRQAARSAPPQLLELQLSGNPLGAAGLQHLCAALRHMPSLQTLGLSDIGLEQGSAGPASTQAAVQALAHALLASPCTLHTLAFDNIIGDGSAAFLLTLAKAKPSLVLIKLSARVSGSTITQLSAVLEEHLKLSKAAPKAHRKGSAAAASSK